MKVGLIGLVRGSWWLIGLVFLAGAACQQTPEVRKDKAVERGRQYLEAGKFGEAVVEFRNALAVDPDLVEALHPLGLAYARKAWYFDAVRELSRARRLAPDSLPIATDLGRALVEIGAWTEAAAEADFILSRQPENPHALYVRAASLLGRGKAAEALAVVERAPKTEPLSALAATRGGALLALGRVDEAERAFRAAVGRNPTDAKSLSGLGAVHLERKDYLAGVEVYEQAKKLDPEQPRIRLGLAVARARLGKLSDAIRELEEVNPRARLPEVVMTLALYHLRAKKPEEAIAILAPLVRQLPRLASARLLLASALVDAERPDEAALELDELAVQLPGEAAVEYHRAVVATKLGRPRAALEQLNAVARHFQGAPEYHFERGRALFLLGRLEEAAQAATLALRLAPRAPQPYLLLGEIRSQQGDFKAARELLGKGAELDAGYAPARLALGRFHLRLGDTQAALREFDAAVEADPGSLEAARTRARELIREKRMGEAVEFLEAAAKRNARDPGFQSLLGTLQLEAGQPGKAGAAFRRASEIGPRAVEPRLGLARLAMTQGREEEAAAQLQEALRIQPGHPTAVLLLAAQYRRLGRLDLAVPMLEAAAKARPKDATFALLLGEVYVKSGRRDEAIARMTEVLKQIPDLVPARLILAQAQLAQGDGASALRELTQVARANPRSEIAPYLMAHAQARLGRMPEARAAYEQALRLNPRFELARFELAALTGRRLDEATVQQQLEGLAQAVKSDPRNVFPRELLARALLLAGRAPAAQEELRQILRLAPTHLWANVILARTLLREGRDEEAARHLETTVRSHPGHAESQALLGRHLRQKGQPGMALPHLEAAVKADPTLADTRLELGIVYAQAGRLDDALTIAQDLERSGGRGPGPSLLKGLVFLARKEPRGAVEALSASLRLRPDLPEVHRGLGEAYVALGETDRAMEHYRRALALSPRDVTSLNNLAWLLSERRRKPEEALPLAAKAAELAPRSWTILDTLGWVHYRRGAYAQAEEVLVRAADGAPADASIQYHLGMTYYRLGRKEDAIFRLRRAAQLDPRLAETEKIEAVIRELGG